MNARLLCPSLSPWVCSSSCPLSQWCHPNISSSVALFSSCSQLFPASGSFPVSHIFPSGGQSIGASASAPVLPMNIEVWFPLGLAGMISLLYKGLSKVFSSTTVRKCQFLGAQPSLFMTQLSHPYISTGKTIALTIWTFISKVMSLLFTSLSSFDIAILSRSESLLISWLQSPSALILEPKKMKSDIVSKISHLCAMKWGPAATIFSSVQFSRWVVSDSLWLHESQHARPPGWHHWLDGRESEWTLGVGDGQGGLEWTGRPRSYVEL